MIIFFNILFPHKDGDTIEDISLLLEFWVGKERLKGERVHEGFCVVLLVLHNFKR